MPAQTPPLDSLKKEFENQPHNDTLRCQLYYQSALYFHGNHEDSADAYLKKMYDLAKRMKYPDGLADYYHYLAVSDKQKQLLDSAMIYARQELEWAKRSADKIKLAFAYNDVGNMHIYFGSGDSAVINLLKGLPIAENCNKPRLASNVSFNLSAAYDMIDNYAASRNYAKKSFKIAEALEDSTYMFKSLYNWATQEHKLGSTDTALVMFHRCIDLAEKLSCEDCLMDVYNNLGEILYSQRRFVESLQQYHKMAQIAKPINDHQYDLYLYMNRGNTFTALGRYEEASEDLAKAQDIGIELKANFELSQIFSFRSQLAEKMNHFKEALAYWKKADSLKTRISQEESSKDIRRLEVQYQTAQKDRSIMEQKSRLVERQASLRKKDMINTGLIIGCLLLAAIAFLAYRNIRQQRRISVKERELHEQKINELKTESQFVAAQSLLKGQEEERSRMARDLHDGVGGLLSGVKLSLSNMKGNVFLSEENAQAVTTIINQLDSSIGELRRVSHNMMPEALIKYGLKEALENYCESIDRLGTLNVRLQTYGLDRRMEQDAEIILYRIIQELLNNVIKYANARQVLIQLIRETDKFTLTVEDDGKGFDINSPNYKSGAGLQNVQARAGYLNGIVDIRAKPGEGTSVTVEGTLR